jgi:hypothetical protein
MPADQYHDATMPAQPKPSVLTQWLALGQAQYAQPPAKHCVRQCGEYVGLPQHLCPICAALVVQG